MKCASHLHPEYTERIDGLGYIISYYLDEPGFATRPHFHIINHITGKNVAICYKENRYADPNNPNRLTSEECKILNDWMKKIIPGYHGIYDNEEHVTNWGNIRDSIHHYDNDWIFNKSFPQPDYSSIKEPLPIPNNFWEIENHVNPLYKLNLGNIIPGIGHVVECESEDPDMYCRPHAHIITDDGRNIELCIMDNRYANPNNPNRFRPDEISAFNNWFHSTTNIHQIQIDNSYQLYSAWCNNMGFDKRIDIPSPDMACKDYSIIKEPLPIKHNDDLVGLICIGECNDVGNIIMFERDESRLYSYIPHFYIQRFEDLIPIGIKTSIYLDLAGPRLNKDERTALYKWMKSRDRSGGFANGCISNWDYIVMTYNRLFPWTQIKDSTKMPNYTRIIPHRISKDKRKY